MALIQIWSAFDWSAFLSIFLFYPLPEVDVSWDANLSFLRCLPLLLSFSPVDTSPLSPLHLCAWMWHHKEGCGSLGPSFLSSHQGARWCIRKCVFKVTSLWSQSRPMGSGRRDESDRWIFPSHFPVLLWGSLSSLPIWVLGEQTFWVMCWIS